MRGQPVDYGDEPRRNRAAIDTPIRMLPRDTARAGSASTFQSLAAWRSHPSASKPTTNPEERLVCRRSRRLSCVLPNYAWGQAAPSGIWLFHGRCHRYCLRKHKIKIAGEKGIVVSANGTVPGRYFASVKDKMSLSTSGTRWLPRARQSTGTGSWFRGIWMAFRELVLQEYRHANLPVQIQTAAEWHYWYHSHTGPQEQIGLYGPLIIDPIQPEPYEYDRDYVVLLSDWTFEDPVRVMDRLKNQPTYYNFQQRTAVDFFREVKTQGWRATLADRLMWGRMRMSATDRLDVTGYRYTYLINGSPLT